MSLPCQHLTLSEHDCIVFKINLQSTKLCNFLTSDMSSCDDLVITFNQATKLVLHYMAPVKVRVWSDKSKSPWLTFEVKGLQKGKWHKNPASRASLYLQKYINNL